jgi:hypothetical protein
MILMLRYCSFLLYSFDSFRSLRFMVSSFDSSTSRFEKESDRSTMTESFDLSDFYMNELGERSLLKLMDSLLLFIKNCSFNLGCSLISSSSTD